MSWEDGVNIGQLRMIYTKWLVSGRSANATHTLSEKQVVHSFHLVALDDDYNGVGLAIDSDDGDDGGGIGGVSASIILK
ncbi:hypothetical protein EGR_08739 [Echinococcus granulosus]|uniref:Uncharacterized protein n=1 Tax=Echinococcus granulosus TaxID=6210 RepID=W6U5K1_ECHGR|nr:hypothetical protein EGR_08739 [Echinococcus granulosus]EUB56425.1 hypothetical protein EGR_08739 [Echinococcus granulosus]